MGVEVSQPGGLATVDGFFLQGRLPLGCLCCRHYQRALEDCITDWLDDNRDYDSAWNKYLVSGRQLELVETVKLKYFGDTGGYFTETKLVNGEWKVTRSNVKEGDFDLEAWKDTYPGQ